MNRTFIISLSVPLGIVINIPYLFIFVKKFESKNFNELDQKIIKFGSAKQKSRGFPWDFKTNQCSHLSGISTLLMQVAGLHRASPSATLDKTDVSDILFGLLYYIFFDFSIVFLFFIIFYILETSVAPT